VGFEVYESNRPQRGLNLVRKLALRKSIEEASRLSKGWDGYAAEAPSSLARERAGEAVERTFELDRLPTKVLPLADGGLALVFMARPFYAAVEIENDGTAVAAFSDRRARQRVWAIQLDNSDLRAALRDFDELVGG
jgi:hypothetical protein